jgi:hypothetical protein
MSMPQGTGEVLAAIEAYAEDCRRAYAASLQPRPTIVPPQLYDAIKAAVAEGSAPEWVVWRWDAGLFVPTERLLIDEAL